MKEILFVLCVVAVTAYLAVTAWEDFRTCEITRWKHLIGFIPAIIFVIFHMKIHSVIDFAMTLAFSMIFIGAGIAGIYGMADGFVLTNLTLFFGSMIGGMGVGVVILIIIIAAFSFLICHVVKCIVKKKQIIKNIKGALVPHIFVGYITVMIITMMQSA